MVNDMEDGVDKDGALQDSWRDAHVPDGFTLAAAGDLVLDDVLSWRLRRESPELVELLQAADVTFGNFESTAIDLDRFGGGAGAFPFRTPNSAFRIRLRA